MGMVRRARSTKVVGQCGHRKMTTNTLTMANNKVGRVQAHFDCLDNELSGGLRKCVRTQTTVEPNTLEINVSICSSLCK